MENIKSNNEKSVLKFIVFVFKILTYLSIFATLCIGVYDLKNIYLYFFSSGEAFDLFAFNIFLVLSVCLAGFTNGLEEGI